MKKLLLRPFIGKIRSRCHRKKWKWGPVPSLCNRLILTITRTKKGPTNHESARESEENVGPCPESVVPCDLATDPTGQRCGK